MFVYVFIGLKIFVLLFHLSCGGCMLLFSGYVTLKFVASEHVKQMEYDNNEH